MDITINNLYFKYDEKSNCINTYDTLTNSLVSYIHIGNHEVMDKNSFENTCQRWSAAQVDNNDEIYHGVEYNSWF